MSNTSRKAGKRSASVDTASVMANAENHVPTTVQDSTPAPAPAPTPTPSSTASFFDEPEARRNPAGETITDLLVNSGRVLRREDGSMGFNPDDEYISSAVRQIGFAIAMAGKGEYFEQFQEKVMTEGTANVELDLAKILGSNAVNRFEFASSLILKTSYFDRPKKSGYSSNIHSNVSVQVTIGADRANPVVFYKDPVANAGNTGEIKDGSRVFCRLNSKDEKTGNADILLSNGNSIRFMPIQFIRNGLVKDSASTLEVVARVTYNIGQDKSYPLLFVSTLGHADASKVNEEVSYTIDRDKIISDAFISMAFNPKTYINGFFISNEERELLAGLITEALSNAYPDGVINTNLGYHSEKTEIKLAGK